MQITPRLRRLAIHAGTIKTVGALGFATLSLVPAVAHWFETSMLMHMLVQIPLLIVAGILLLQKNTRPYQWLTIKDPGGIIALVLGTGWMLFWMLPLHLDLATIDPWFRLLKVVSIPLGIGLCFCWAWIRSNLLLRLMIAFEVVASVARLGWIFIESPEQLCSSYLINEQQTVGTLLLGIAGCCFVAALLWGLFGSFASNPPTINAEY